MLDTKTQALLERPRIKGGDRVRVRLGAMVFQTDPKLPEFRLNRSLRTVIVQNLFPEGGQIKVTWSGRGSYWCWADIRDVEPAERLP